MIVAALMIAGGVFLIAQIIGSEQSSGQELARWSVMAALFIGGAITAGWMGVLTVLLAYAMLTLVGVIIVVTAQQ